MIESQSKSARLFSSYLWACAAFGLALSVLGVAWASLNGGESATGYSFATKLLHASQMATFLFVVVTFISIVLAWPSMLLAVALASRFQLRSWVFFVASGVVSAHFYAAALLLISSPETETQIAQASISFGEAWRQNLVLLLLPASGAAGGLCFWWRGVRSA